MIMTHVMDSGWVGKVFGIPPYGHPLAASKATHFELASTRLALTALIPISFQREHKVRDQAKPTGIT